MCVLFSSKHIQEEIQNSPSMSVLLVEAFYGGSHKQLIDLLRENVDDCVSYTLPAKKWHWRARTAALYFMQAIPASPSYRVLFASSVLNLSELVALRPDLATLKKVLYFHENQLVYPVRKSQDRDFQYGYNQVLSCLVADVVAFNSSFNMDSFLSSISSFMKMIPDHRPKDLDKLIRPKCRVLHFPIQFPHVTSRPEVLRSPVEEEKEGLLSLSSPLAPKALSLSPEPEAAILDQREGTGQAEAPSHPREERGPGGGKEEGDGGGEESHVRPLHIVWPHRWLEAVHCGCYPLCPKALVYPEIFPEEYLYSTPEQLYKKLQGLCRRPYVVRRHHVKVDTNSYSWAALKEDFRSLLAYKEDHHP
ncbi:glycosyltransferase-like domain-containing protein 1 isoform X4 [Salvelinus fontinalis]|uniref:glycosyltransferase-like domain-containing protein 1 isoform X4 n=1 Tax=Salvelinus fontinalis TaxID=8038 RepID=UPI002485B0DA|nr:glycosyltransferase-like domain-containing protein 1 isoform X4 [Salvelinus fontinalis]